MRAVCYLRDLEIGFISRNDDGRMEVSDPSLDYLIENSVAFAGREVSQNSPDFLECLAAAHSAGKFPMKLEEQDLSA